MQQAETRLKDIQSTAFIVAVSVCILLVVCFVFSTFVHNGQRAQIVLETRINPNEAPVGSLVRLPGIGIGRARAIAAYREDFRQQWGDDGVAFETVEDLQKVKGIGPKTAQNIGEWLKFE